MSKSEPSWETAARIDGLPCTNWKKRTGVTISGTLAQCISRWIDLLGHQRQNCSFGWGPFEGRYGDMDAEHLAAYVRRNGIPPVWRQRVAASHAKAT
jgi:hypothetical protein